jgi:hypothetical protein
MRKVVLNVFSLQKLKSDSISSSETHFCEYRGADIVSQCLGFDTLEIIEQSMIHSGDFRSSGGGASELLKSTEKSSETDITPTYRHHDGQTF